MSDGLGSVRQVVGPAGEVTLGQGYTPFGGPLWSAGRATSGYGFTGERWDGEVGLLYLRARYYAPGVGRFVTRDVWEGDYEQPLTLNPYLYALANPVNVSDPSGRQCTGCQTAGDWAAFALYYGYGIHLGSGPSGFTFADPEKVLILETVTAYADLLGGQIALKRNLALSIIRMEWTSNDGGFNAFYSPVDRSITLPPNWYIGRIAMSPDGLGGLIALQPCLEDRLDFPPGSLPTDEIKAKYVLAHEMGHAFHTGNPRALRSFKSRVDLPLSFLAWSNSNPLIARNAFRDGFDREVFSDVTAAYLYSPSLLNQQMLNWILFDMPGVLR